MASLQIDPLAQIWLWCTMVTYIGCSRGVTKLTIYTEMVHGEFIWYWESSFAKLLISNWKVSNIMIWSKTAISLGFFIVKSKKKYLRNPRYFRKLCLYYCLHFSKIHISCCWYRQKLKVIEDMDTSVIS